MFRNQVSSDGLELPWAFANSALDRHTAQLSTATGAAECARSRCEVGDSPGESPMLVAASKRDGGFALDRRLLHPRIAQAALATAGTRSSSDGGMQS